MATKQTDAYEERVFGERLVKIVGRGKAGVCAITTEQGAYRMGLHGDVVDVALTLSNLVLAMCDQVAGNTDETPREVLQHIHDTVLELMENDDASG